MRRILLAAAGAAIVWGAVSLIAFGLAIQDYARSEAGLQGTGGIRLLEGRVERVSRVRIGAPEYRFRVSGFADDLHLPMEFLPDGASRELAAQRIREGASVWLKCYEANGLVLELYAPARSSADGAILSWDRSQQLRPVYDSELQWHGTRTILLGLMLPVWAALAWFWIRRRVSASASAR